MCKRDYIFYASKYGLHTLLLFMKSFPIKIGESGNPDTR
jgi:hypothetical protein